MEKVNILKSVDIINSRIQLYKGERKYLDTGSLNLNVIEDVVGFNFSEKPSRANQNVQIGDIILARMKGTTKVKVISVEDQDLMVSTGFVVFRPKQMFTYVKYLNHIFLSSIFQREKDKLCTGATQKAINNGNIKKLEIPLPSLPQQKKIASILDAVDELKQNDKGLISKFDELIQALFLDMFGDPVSNPMGWDLQNIRTNCEKFCDGPFGSNLKSVHYVETGVRVIRLQNIGSGVFIDKDKAYIKEEHAQSLNKNHCLPGDIIIGTMGEPNLRACILPENISLAINKADCLICRPNASVFNTTYLTCLLNYKSFVNSLSDLILGQTRGRISMGRLSTRDVIAPPIQIQEEFAKKVQSIEIQKALAQKSLAKSEELFNSLLQTVFKGEINDYN